MGLQIENSDYGSGSSINSGISWRGEDLAHWSLFQSQLQTELPKKRASSFQDLLMGRCTISDVMQEFRMNGSDTPYDPDEDKEFQRDEVITCGPGSYMRQRSWPAAERTPRRPMPPRAPPLAAPPIAASLAEPLAARETLFEPSYTAPCETIGWPSVTAEEFVPLATSSRNDVSPIALGDAGDAAGAGAGAGAAGVSAAQLAALRALPPHTLAALLAPAHVQVRREQPLECRFCKNNGEREAYYRSHSLKDARGLVECPVLRAHTCPRCGQRGDNAHTAKYCPQASRDERIKSAAMMRSVRQAARRTHRRHSAAAPAGDYVTFGERPHSLIQDNAAYKMYELEPLWAALEKKLML